ncbi:hypothetical protein RRG08_047735 [Elysia crispata]|uniref:Uncharacterized protein n=1 Tax=Elysia crispata TaxID=231223 RepID=A0AAE1A944_9GAST|nr:hypothetical protein RRG08_047735 [Elysia crispata]
MTPGQQSDLGFNCSCWVWRETRSREYLGKGAHLRLKIQQQEYKLATKLGGKKRSLPQDSLLYDTDLCFTTQCVKAGFALVRSMRPCFVTVREANAFNTKVAGNGRRGRHTPPGHCDGRKRLI